LYPKLNIRTQTKAVSKPNTISPEDNFPNKTSKGKENINRKGFILIKSLIDSGKNDKGNVIPPKRSRANMYKLTKEDIWIVQNENNPRTRLEAKTKNIAKIIARKIIETLSGVKIPDIPTPTKIEKIIVIIVPTIAAIAIQPTFNPNVAQ
jgi:hypothetical protein